MQDLEIVESFKGKFGKVYSACKRTNSDENYATKFTKKKKISHTNITCQLVIEKNSLATIESTYSVQLLYSLQPTIPSVHSIMEYMVGRDLSSLLKVYSLIEEYISKFYDAQLSPALEYLYSRGIIKKDMSIKPCNILLTKEGYAKYADFSLGEISTHQDVIISYMLLNRIMTWNNITNMHCKYSYFFRYRCISRNSKNYRTTLLFKAIKSCEKSLVKQLLNRGVYIKAVTTCCFRHNRLEGCFHSFLMVNAIYGNSDITRMLIHAGCDLNIATNCGVTALHLAIGFDKRDVAVELISSGANVHLTTLLTKSPPLHLAIVYSTHIDDKKNILRLHSHFVRVMKYIFKFIFFIFLIRADNLGKLTENKIVRKRRVCLYLVKMLLDSGADVNYKNKYGCSAIHYAAFTGNLELMKILIEAGADINSRNMIGATALHNAVLFEDEEIVLLLLKNGADVTIKTHSGGDSALHLASAIIDSDRYGYESILRKLLEHGGDVNDKNANNKTIVNVGRYPYSIISYVAELEARIQKQVFDDYNLAVIKRNRLINNYYKKVQAELTAMRDNKIKNTAISFWSILTEPLEEVARWVQNKEFVNNFKTSDYEIAYPNYASCLREKIVAATKHGKKRVKWGKVELSGDI